MGFVQSLCESIRCGCEEVGVEINRSTCIKFQNSFCCGFAYKKALFVRQKMFSLQLRDEKLSNILNQSEYVATQVFILVVPRHAKLSLSVLSFEFHRYGLDSNTLTVNQLHIPDTQLLLE